MDSRWYILRVVSGREEEARVSLPIPSYYPVEEGRWFSRRQRCWKERLHPFFPGYLFALMVEPVRVHSPSVLGFMRTPNRQHASISEDELQDLRDFAAIYNESLRRVELLPKHSFIPGEEVKFQRGPFKGRRGIIDLLQGDFGLEVHFKGRNAFKVRTDTSFVRKLSEKLAA